MKIRSEKVLAAIAATSFVISAQSAAFASVLETVNVEATMGAITSDKRQLASVVPAPPADAGAASRLSPAALEVAHDLAILPAVDELLEAEKTKGADSLDVIRVRQRLLETIITASFEVRSAISRIDDEITHCNEMRNIMESRREKRVEVSDVVNFMNSGSATILSSAFTNFQKGAGNSGSSLIHAGGVIAVASGALEIAISTLSLKLNKGEHRSAPIDPNMLAPLFGYDGPEARFPEGVWEYLTDPVPNSKIPGETRQRFLVRSWLHLGRIYSATTPQGKRHIGLVTATVPQTKEITIGLLEDRALMLSDLRAAISSMDRVMLEIMHWVKTL